MAYAVDFVLNVMKQISSERPVLFQRDGSLYVASSKGFGQVNYGLRTTPEMIQDWEQRDQPAEILESEDVFSNNPQKADKKLVIKRKELPYIKPIIFGPDDNSFSLEEVTRCAQGLAKLEDDGKIRMVSHGSGYHSHKYGYAADGIDVWINSGRVMDRERYLQLIREREEKILESIKAVGAGDSSGGDYLGEAFRRLCFPDCTILTPNLMVSLPRKGRLFFDSDKPSSWTPSTRLTTDDKQSYGSILHLNPVDKCQESPFGIHVMLNTHAIDSVDAQTFEDESQEVLKKVQRDITAVSSHMDLAEIFLAELNGIHNKVCAINIQWSKDLEKRLKT